MILSQIQFDITNRCNMSCTHCRNGDLQEKDIRELALDECKRVFDEARMLGCQWVNICGGEPLLHKDVYSIIKYTSRYANTILLTNGYLIDNEVANKLRQANTTLVQISLDSSVPGKHDEMRNRKGAYDHVFRAVEALNKEEVEVCFMVTLSRQNKDEFSSILELANNAGVSFVNFRRLIPQGRGCDHYNDMSLSKDEIRTFLDDVKNLETKYSIGICLFPFYTLKDENELKAYMEEPSKFADGGCSAAIGGLAVDSYGDLLLCPHIPKKLGNIREDSLEEVWSKNATINLLRDRRNLKGQCGVCKFSNICGGCRAYPYQLNGDILGEDELCTEFYRNSKFD